MVRSAGNKKTTVYNMRYIVFISKIQENNKLRRISSPNTEMVYVYRDIAPSPGSIITSF